MKPSTAKRWLADSLAGRNSRVRALRLTLCAVCLVLSAFAAPRSAGAQEPQGVGTIAVSPTRVIFEGRTRSAEVTLLNQGTDTTTYRVFFTYRRMLEDGKLELVEPGPDDRTADKLVRYSPRQVTIPGLGSQTVRLLLRKPKDLPPGEYRSHLVFRALPPADVGQDVEALDLEPGQLAVRLIPTFSVAIPVIIRHGDLSASISISEASFEAIGAEPVVSLRLNREGNRSMYTDMIVTSTTGNGERVEVGRLLGVSVYTPNPSRIVRIKLQPPDGVSLKGGQLKVEAFAIPEEGGGLLAESTVTLP